MTYIMTLAKAHVLAALLQVGAPAYCPTQHPTATEAPACEVLALNATAGVVVLIPRAVRP